MTRHKGMMMRNPNAELADALREEESVRAAFAAAGCRLPKLSTVTVPTWRGGIAPGIVSVLKLGVGITAYVGVKTPALATADGEAGRVFRTRFGLWVCEYSGTIAGKSVIAIDCVVRGAKRVWWLGAHVGSDRSRAIDDLSARLGLDRIKVTSHELEERMARHWLRQAAKWAADMQRFAAVAGEQKN